MANIMSLKNVRNKASRNGFDLSRRTCFSSKVGELLPVWWQYVLPGDSFNIDLKSFTRTQPVNTASYGRIREYYDFFFVPFEQLWNKSPEVLTQMLDNKQHATGLNSNQKLSGDLPCMASLSEINLVLGAMVGKVNEVGFERRNCALKLLSYLGYGQPNTDGLSLAVQGDSNPNVSIFPLLAYQKIYADFFRYTQWESPNPSTFNVDWMTGNNDTVLQASSFTNYDSNTMFDLRYCNYQKDLFHGIMPNAQFGETAAVPINSGSVDISLDTESSQGISKVTTQSLGGTNGVYFPYSQVPFSNSTQIQGADSGRVAVLGDSSSSNQWLGAEKAHKVVTDVSVNYGKYLTSASLSSDGAASVTSNLSILALRQAEALQRWKEVAQAAEEDYKQQIQAHWNVNVSDLLSGQCRYLGGHSSGININEVVNTNLVNGDAAQPADLAGKGVGSLNGQISFNSQGEYGVIMCIYHALPLLDYITSGTDAKLFHVQGSSFPIPEMDSIGMELLPTRAVTNTTLPNASTKTFMGYVPRYIDWKTDYDRCVGAFVGDMSSWILPFSDTDFWNFASLGLVGDDDNPNVTDSNYVQYPYFKVDPSIVNPMFAVEADSTMSTDQLLSQCYIQCYVTRNLDVNGLPY